jgi:hypothetical protein
MHTFAEPFVLARAVARRLLAKSRSSRIATRAGSIDSASRRNEDGRIIMKPRDEFFSRAER